jgi:acetyltransferase-like isoleucine patch superfamily enzyme
MCSNKLAKLQVSTAYVAFHYLRRKSRFFYRSTRILFRNVDIHPTADIAWSAEFRPDGGLIKLGKYTIIDRGVLFRAYGGEIELGSYSTVGPYSCLYGGGILSIGSFVRIGPNVCIASSNHVFERLDLPIAKQGMRGLGIHIGDDVWIGAGAILLDGISVGTGSVIGAGSVVTKNVAEYSVVAGVPATLIRLRDRPTHIHLASGLGD